MCDKVCTRFKEILYTFYKRKTFVKFILLDAHTFLIPFRFIKRKNEKLLMAAFFMFSLSIVVNPSYVIRRQTSDFAVSMDA